MLDFSYFCNDQSRFIIKELADSEGNVHKYFVTVGPLDDSKQINVDIPMTFAKPYSQE